MDTEELFDWIDEENRVIGQVLRKECHGNPALLHRAVHVVICHPETGHLLLQKRSATKDIQPGKWDTAVGGHLDQGESFEAAARREMAEELGLTDPNLPLVYLFDSKIRNTVESENIRVFGLRHAGPFTIQKREIDEIHFWSEDELCAAMLLPDLFTPNLKIEIQRLIESNLLKNWV